MISKLRRPQPAALTGRESTRGFTLIELVIVIVVIGIMSSLAARIGGQVLDAARVDETREELERLAFAVAGDPRLENNGVRSDFGYVGDVGAMPADLDALYTNPGSYSTWNGPYIQNTLEQITDDYKKDAWAIAYTFSGGNTITSTGSGSNLIRRIANSTDDLLYNSVSGNVVDLDGSPPDTTYRDSISVKLTYPDGVGGMATTSASVGPGGYFAVDSVPVGNHSLEIVYSPTNDTLRRYVAVTSNSDVYGHFALLANHWPVAPSYFEVLRPNATGTADNFSGSGCSSVWECVDDVTADDDATYVYKGGGGWNNETYAAENSAISAGTINYVIIYVRASQSEPIRVALRTGGSLYESSDISTSGSYADYSNMWTTNPDTSSPWTWSEIDNLEIGVTLKSSARATQVWMEVNYTP